MGIWMDLLVAPRQTRLLPHDQFGELLHDLLQCKIVKMPCAMLSGDHLNVTASLSIANEFLHHQYIDGKWVTHPLDFPPGTKLHPSSGGTGVIHYCGERVEELLRALDEAPYGMRDLCVWFECLNFDNQEVASTGNYNADVVVYSLAEPQEIFYVETDGWRMEVNRDEMEEDDYPNNKVETYTYVVQSCFRTTGKNGPYKTCAPMDAIFKRYFGKDFIVDCSYS